MIAIQLTAVKTFMRQLLCSEMFDHFLLMEASIVKDATFSIDGRINASFYTKEELEEEGLSHLKALPYGKLRPVCYQLMKGRRTPVSFKFILLLSPEHTADALAQSKSSFTANDVTGIFLNLLFQNGNLTLTTGISYALFSTDRTLDQEWDILVRKFLNKYDVSYEEL